MRVVGADPVGDDPFAKAGDAEGEEVVTHVAVEAATEGEFREEFDGDGGVGRGGDDDGPVVDELRGDGPGVGHLRSRR